MTISTKKITKEIIIYTSEDGEEFECKSLCLFHEWECQATSVYVVYNSGQLTDKIEIYSTYDLAEKAAKKSTNYYIKEIKLDERFWNEKIT